MKFGIGTVQFGINYGISNKIGKTSSDEVKKILEYSSENKIDLIDTAYLYGDSELVLGDSLSQTLDFHIITKTPAYKKDKINSSDAENLKKTFLDSLKKLKKEKLEGLLIHNAVDLMTDGGEVLFSAMEELKKEGLVKKIGVSVYTDEQIDCLIQKFKIDIIQLPLNVFDQKLIHSGHLKTLKSKNIEIHVRSIFLQGLLLMDEKSLNPFFLPVKYIIRKYNDFLISKKLTQVEGAMAFIKQIKEIDYIIIGINDLEQLKINYNAFNKNYSNLNYNDFKDFSIDDPNFINPSLWRLN